MRKFAPSLVIGLLLVGLLGACSRGGDSAPTVLAPTTSPASTTPATTAPAPTTPATTAPAPTTTTLPAQVPTTATPTTVAPTTTTTAPVGTTSHPLSATDLLAAVRVQLFRLGYRPGTGPFGDADMFALRAFQHATGFASSDLTAVLTAARSASPPPVLDPSGEPNRVEISLARQIAVVYRNSHPILITAVSTGRPALPTPPGHFRVYSSNTGWYKTENGSVYSPRWFDNNVGLHGFPSVPDYPASHGCVRMPLYVADEVASIVTTGWQVIVA